MPIDYERMKKSYPVLKRRLTLAKKKGPKAVLKAVEDAYKEFDAIGAYPDGWHLWESAKSDAEFALRFNRE